MRKLITILLLFAYGFSQAQGYTNNIFTAVNGDKIAYGVSKTPANPNGNKHAMVFFLHGGGEGGPEGDTITSNGLGKVTNYGIPLYIKTAHIGWWTPPNGTAKDTRGFVIIFPQMPSKYNFYYPEWLLEELVKKAISTLHTTCDTTRIYLAGMSMGGHGSWAHMKSTYLRRKCAYWRVSSPANPPYTNYQVAANEGAPGEVFMAVNDNVVPIANPDNAVTNTNFYRPFNAIQYRRFAGTTAGTVGHQIENVVFNTTKGGVYALSTGGFYIKKYNFYETALQFTNIRYLRP